jgi:hypothetical protein
MTIPRRWRDGGLGEFAGRVRFRRRFSWPRGLAEHERLWLVFAGIEHAATAWLNDQQLGQHPGPVTSLEFNITTHVQVKNQLVVEVDSPGPGGGIWGDVTLQVRHVAFFRKLEVHATSPGGKPQIQLTAFIEDESERQLELYVLLNGRTVHYSSVFTRREFQLQFNVEAELLGQSDSTLQIELVDVATKVDYREYRIDFQQNGCV